MSERLFWTLRAHWLLPHTAIAENSTLCNTLWFCVSYDGQIKIDCYPKQHEMLANMCIESVTTLVFGDFY